MVVVPVEQRKCRLCDSGMVEDEQHLLMECLAPDLIHERKHLSASANKYIQGYETLSDKEKFCEIMTSKEPNIIIALGKFFTSALHKTTFKNTKQLMSCPHNARYHKKGNTLKVTSYYHNIVGLLYHGTRKHSTDKSMDTGDL